MPFLVSGAVNSFSITIKTYKGEAIFVNFSCSIFAPTKRDKELITRTTTRMGACDAQRLYRKIVMLIEISRYRNLRFAFQLRCIVFPDSNSK